MTETGNANTDRTYKRVQAHFKAWCEDSLVVYLPADPSTVASYLEYLVKEGHRPMSTARTYSAAIAALHRDAGHASPSDHPEVKAALRTLASHHTNPSRRTEGLTAEGLNAISRMVAAYGESESKGAKRARVDLALILVMRNGLLRASEAAAIRWGDVALLEDGGALIHTVLPQTAREGRALPTYIGREAVRALLATQPDGAVLAPEQKVFGMSDRQINRRIKAAAASAGLYKEYSGNSMRVGMIQDLNAALQGPNAEGRLLSTLVYSGHWSSPTMPARYGPSAPPSWVALPDELSEDESALLLEYLAAHGDICSDDDEEGFAAWASGSFVIENDRLDPGLPNMEGDLRYRSVLTRAKMWKERHSAGRQAGYGDGYMNGCDYGHQAGRRAGYAEGRQEGYAKGHREGYDEGRRDGYAQGLREREESISDVGYDEGHRDGYDEGYKNGHRAGVDESRILEFWAIGTDIEQR